MPQSNPVEPGDGVTKSAHAAGLARALERFPQNVHDAVQLAASLRGMLPEIDDVTAEPWQP